MYTPKIQLMSAISRLSTWIILLVLGFFFLQKCQINSGTTFPKPINSSTEPLESDPILADSILSLRKKGATKELDELIAQLKKQLVAHDPNLAFAMLQRGIAEYYKGNYHGTIPYYKDAVLRYEKNSHPSDFNTICRLYRNIGMNYYFLSNYSDSTYYFANQGLEKMEKYPDSLIEDKIRLGLYQWAGIAARDLGDIANSADLLKMGVDICAQDRGDYKICGTILMNYAWTLMDQNELDAALRYSKSAERRMLDNAAQFNYYDSTSLADIYNNRFEIHSKGENYVKALAVQGKSLLINQAIRPKSESVAKNYNNIAYVYSRMGKLAYAKFNLRKSIDINRTNKDTFLIAKNMEILGDIAVSEGRDMQAIEYYEEALANFFPNPHDLPYSAAIHKSEMGLPMSQRARALYRLHKKKPVTYPLPDVLIAYQQVDSLVSALQYAVRLEQSKMLAVEQLKPVYEDLIEICEARWQATEDPVFLEKAFIYLERSKALVLRERQQKRQGMQGSGTTKFQDQERQLVGEITRLQYNLQTTRYDQTEGVRLLNQLHRQEQALRRYRDSLYYTIDSYENYLVEGSSKITSEIQKRLSDDRLVLDYFVGEDAVFVGVLSSKEMSIHRLGVSQKELEKYIGQLSLAITRSATDVQLAAEERKNLDEQYHSSAYWLHQALLSPLDIAPSHTNLTIIPDGILSYLPFAALLTERAEDTAPYPYLLKEKCINQQFSLAIWHDNLKRKYADGKGVLVIAPTQSKRLSISALDGNGNPIGLSSLNYNTEEVAHLSEHFQTKVLAGAAASRDRVEQLIGEYQVIHFAGHGYADVDNPYASFLAFDIEQNRNQRAALLSLEELERLDLRANLMVLSACQTADGSLAKGEGVISLSRAATLAGAKSVVSNLWPMNQQTKVSLFHGFYDELAKGLPKDKALRQAQLDYISRDDERSHPYHWAGVVNIGDVAPIKLKAASFWRSLVSNE